MRRELLLISLTSLPGRYAKALFETSRKKSDQDEILKNFESLSTFLKKNTEVERILLSSILNKKRLDEVWQEVGKKMKLVPFFLSFIRVLAKEGRLPLLHAIYEKYQTLIHFYNNERALTVLSSYPLTNKEKSGLQKSLSQIFTEKISMTFAIDETILSGIVVKTDTFVLDASYRIQLKQLSQALKG